MKTKSKNILKNIVTIICSLLVVTAIILALVFFAPTISLEKPQNSSTQNQPFVQGMSKIKKFRIPAIVTMPDGTIVASCDARWNLQFDGGGLDTIASYSTDNGDNWNYTFANYLGDNGNRYDARSSTFIDSEIICATDGTLYLATTFYPASVSLNSTPKTPLKDRAFNSNGQLLICKGNSGVYDCTLSDFDRDGFAYVLDSNGNAIEDYKVDRYFNIYKKGKQKGNLFFMNAPFSVVETTYIYLNKSYDSGKTWDSPKLLDVKSDDCEFYGIAPGRGLQLDDGTLIFSTYSLTDGNGDSQKSSFIYSRDNGVTWSAAPQLEHNGWSSESQLVKLDEQNLRCFFRNDSSKICYCDVSINDDEIKWGTPVITEFDICSNCMISAINLNSSIDGKRVIAVSCPTNIEKRADGKIFVFTIEPDNDMQLYKTIPVKDGAFAYSCLTQTKDGKIAILYEAEHFSVIFKKGIEI